ncbi:MAG: hypothetical protein QOK16_237 [Solirubrobacteraceae bacterium]|nr:hypothetical protein [Solirubrobacteraceae bacterium]
MRRLLLAVLAATLVVPGSAYGADPIMPLADVQPGMRCTSLSVVRGTEIASFDVEVLDVIDRERGPEAARILVRVSGPVIDATGLGPGFSGSPIFCAGADGVRRNIGALSETIGEYGGKTAIATPIEAILAQPLQPPGAAPRTSRVVGARSLAGPLTIAGLRPSIAAMFTRAARKAGRALITSSAAPRAAFPPQPLVPGAAVSVGLSSGDVYIGALGTVAYADDDSNVWLFGHGIDDVGRRSLFLQDAYISTVVNNPVAIPDVSTYKLGSPGTDLGIVNADGPKAIAGRLGALPPNYALKISAHDLDTGRERSSFTRIADESDVGRPAGISPLGVVATAAVAEVAAEVLGGAPARQSGDMCVAVTLRELRTPMRFCNTYAIDGTVTNALAGPAAQDMAAAVAVLESYRFGTLHPTGIEVGLRVRRGLRQAFIVGGKGPDRARRGTRIAIRLKLRRTGTGARSFRTIHVRLPSDLEPGPHTIRLAGTVADIGSNPDEQADVSVLFEESPGADQDPGAESLDAVRSDFEELGRYDGIIASIGDRPEVNVYRDPKLRITGEARTRVTITR